MTADAGFNRNQIKYIAIAAMLIDHIAECFLSSDTVLYCVFRIIGRLTGPLMFLFLTEGILHTRSRLKYGLRLFMFALISQVPYALCFHNSLCVMDLNVGVTLLLSLFVLLVCEKTEERIIRFAMVFILVSLSALCDWGVIGPLIALSFYKYRNKVSRVMVYSVISAMTVISSFALFGFGGEPWYKEWWCVGIFLVIPFLFFYNGEPGSKKKIHKWIFYVFYPLHLLVIYLIRIL